jgi:hypothetical protein
LPAKAKGEPSGLHLALSSLFIIYSSIVLACS